jgi:hypothetical protein
MFAGLNLNDNTVLNNYLPIDISYESLIKCFIRAILTPEDKIKFLYKKQK